MSTSKPVFASVGFKNRQPAPPIDAIIEGSNAQAAEHGIMTIMTSAPEPSSPAATSLEPAPTPAKPNRSQPTRQPKAAAKKEKLTRRLTVELPTYLIAEMDAEAQKKARDTGVAKITYRYLVAKALKADGFHVEPEDLLEDMRRDYD